MRYPKLRELREAVKALLKGPYTSRFPYEPHEPFERFRGKPYFHEEDCTGCTACAQVCPAKAIDYADEVKNGKTIRTLTVRWDICVFCGQCEANCLTGKGIMLSREFDFATTGKRQELSQAIEKEFVVCQSCSEPVVPFDQYAWVSRRLGPLTFSNASLLLFYLRSMALSFKDVPLRKKGEPTRASRIYVLCPRCRRQAVLKS